VIYLLGIDMVSGTPVIDIKPYIPQYDSPWNLETCTSDSENISVKQREQQHCCEYLPASQAEPVKTEGVEVNECESCADCEAKSLPSAIASDQLSDISQNILKPDLTVAKWITNYLQPSLSVIFTGRAEEQLKQFDSQSQDTNFQLRHLANASELRSTLIAVLQADPRSVYRRKHCQHHLYYLTVDTAHVTCWFDVDTVEVLKVQPAVLMQFNN